MILFFISLLIIVVALCAIVLIDSPEWHYALVAVCLAGVWLMCLGWRKMYTGMDRRVRREIASLKDADTTPAVHTDPKPVVQTPKLPPMPKEKPLLDRLATLKEYLIGYAKDEQQLAEYRRLFANMEKAAMLRETMDAIGQHTVVPLRTNIDSLSSDELEGRLLQLAMAAYDLSTGFHSIDGEIGSIASHLAAGRTNQAEADKTARIANNHVLETPAYIRALLPMAAQHPDTPLYVNDYKL